MNTSMTEAQDIKKSGTRIYVLVWLRLRRVERRCGVYIYQLI